jgi:signal transduction histidine kinase
MKVESPYKDGVGILSMQERVKLIGGQLDSSQTSRGTTVTVHLPIPFIYNGNEPFVFTP